MSNDRRANKLYWESKQSVNSIADELGLSKGRLYDAVQPIPSGSPCPACGTELVFENRTARDRNAATCPSCGAEAQASSERSGAPRAAAADGESGEHRLSPYAGRILIGAAIGGALGVLLVSRLRR